MSELQIDEEMILKLVDALKNLIVQMSSDIDDLAKRDADIFVRYMSYTRLTVLYFILKEQMPIFHNTFKSGFLLGNKIFQTEDATKCGWNDNDPSSSQFFVSEESPIKEVLIRDQDLPEDIRTQIHDLIKKNLDKVDKEIH